MYTIYTDKKGKPLLVVPPNALFRAEQPKGAVGVFEFDEETNSTLRAIVDNPEDLEALRVTHDGVTWHGAKIPLRAEHENTTRQRAVDGAFDRLYTGDGPMDADDIRLVLQQLAMRAGFAVPRAEDRSGVTPE